MMFICKVIAYYTCCIFVATYISLLEMKLIARIQRRVGPSNCGICGIFQPIADAIKLFFKAGSFAGHTKTSIAGICLLFAVTLYQLTLIPTGIGIFPEQNSALLMILSQSLIVFSEILLGIGSASKYGIIGGNRAYIQNLGGHLLLMLMMIIVMLTSNSTCIADFMTMPKDAMFWIKYTPFAVIFFITILITGNRTPFDFTEAESELVGGAYVEYGGILFAMIYLADYLNLIFISALFSTLFLGKIFYAPVYLIEILIKTMLVICFIVLFRAILPRYTQQKMINISWKLVIICCAILLCCIN